MRRDSKSGLGAVVAAVLLLTATTAVAERLVYEIDDVSLFSVDIPDGWLVDLDFAQEATEAGVDEPQFRVVEISPGDGSHVWMGLWALPQAETLERAASYITSLRQELFTDVAMSEPAGATVNGMKALTSKGTAKREGEAVELAVALFEPRTGAIVAALYVGEVEAWRAHSAELEAMIGSLEPAD